MGTPHPPIASYDHAFLFAEYATFLFAENNTFLIAENDTFLFAGYSELFLLIFYFLNSSFFFSSYVFFNWTGVAAAGGAAEFDLGTSQFFNVIIDGANNPGFNNNANGSIKVRGNWTNNNAAVNLISVSTTVTFNGSGAQTLGGVTGYHF